MNLAQKVYCEKVYDFSNITADTDQTAFTLPKLNEYNFYLTVTSITGTASSMDVSLEVSPDGGTTWLTFARFAQISDSNGPVKQRLRFRPIDNGFSVPGVDTLGYLGGALAQNCPLPGTTARFHIEETGTITDFDGTIWLVGNPVEMF